MYQTFESKIWFIVSFFTSQGESHFVPKVDSLAMCILILFRFELSKNKIFKIYTKYFNR